MNIIRLKAKNQLTIPVELIKKLKLRQDELFSIAVDGNALRLVPVDVEPRYSADELDVIDHLVEKEKSAAKSKKAGKAFSGYIKQMMK